MIYGIFKIMGATVKAKTWKAVGANPKTEKSMTIHGGQAGTAVRKNNPKSERSLI